MPRIIEISGRIRPGMWDYNVLDLGDVTLPPVAVNPRASVSTDGFDAHEITVTTLTATYTETAAHMIDGARTIDQVALSELVRPARLMRIPVSAPRTLIRLDDLQQNDPGLEPGEALVIDTGWGSRWDEPGYVTDAPAFAASTLEWFQAQPFSILVLDTPVMECLWCAEEGLAGEQGDLLTPLYRGGMLLVAPVVNLDQIESQTGTLISMPLPVEGVSSAPCRAVFVEGVDWGRELRDG